MPSMPLVIQTCSTCLQTTVSMKSGLLSIDPYPQQSPSITQDLPYPIQDPPPFLNSTKFNNTAANTTGPRVHKFNVASRLELDFMALLAFMVCSAVFLL